MLKASRYFHTLRYLRPVQIYGRLWHKLYRPKPDITPPPCIRPLSGAWYVPAKKSPSLIASNRFRFLNEEHDIISASDWNRPDCTKLWLYNLHYFDDLNVATATERRTWHRALITRWVEENPPARGNGWEPYPLSLRIVNWIKWALADNALPPMALKSLAVQVRFLAKRMEFHLQGNHLFANAKALVFAGMFFEGREADAWIDKGLWILKRELSEQILEDGGHFELSPMYHSIILEDLLDLINLMRAFPAPLPLAPPRQGRGRLLLMEPVCIEAVRRMLVWLKIMCHPDGQIALLNDAAFGIASHPAELYAYSERLGIHDLEVSSSPQTQMMETCIETLSPGHIKVTHLKASGYIRVDNGPMTAILDVACIGPDHLPGHAHADTLTFEMFLYDQRVIIDSGTSRYDEGHERLRQRGTAAHNTVVINSKDSSVVWGSFRVARRAKPFGLEIEETPEGAVRVRCAHDGYRRLSGKQVHWREWHFQEHSLTVRDVIEGRFSEAVGRFYFHPNIRAIPCNSSSQGEIQLLNGSKMKWHIIKGHGNIINAKYYPEFGMTYQNQCLEIQLNGNASHVVFNWR